MVPMLPVEIKAKNINLEVISLSMVFKDIQLDVINYGKNIYTK